MKTITLEDILSPAQLDHLQKLINKNKDPISRTAAFKQYFETLREMLESQGLDPLYLAYATEYAVQSSGAAGKSTTRRKKGKQ